MQRKLLAFPVLAAAMSTLLQASSDRPDRGASAYCATRPDGETAARIAHQRHLARTGARPAAASQDIGEIAVIVDNGAIMIPQVAPAPFDLPLPSHVSWTPLRSPDGVRFDVSASRTTGLDPALSDVGADGQPLIGPALTFGHPGTFAPVDDDTQQVPLPFNFPFQGRTYSSVWVNSDGNITFGAPDFASTPRDVARLVSGPPRVAALLDDLNPAAGGSVHANVLEGNRLVVTWQNVPVYGTALVNTFQITLHAAGTITFAYADIRSTLAVVGVARGGSIGPYQEVDLSDALRDQRLSNLSAAAIFEEFHPGHRQRFNILAATREFYRTHADKYDLLVFFTEPKQDLGGAWAYEINVSNGTRGLGLDVFDNSAYWGSAGELESVINMGRIGIYSPTPSHLTSPPLRSVDIDLERFGVTRVADSSELRQSGTFNLDPYQGRLLIGPFLSGLFSPVAILAHEVEHRWGAFDIGFRRASDPPDTVRTDLRDGCACHWNFAVDSRVPTSYFESADGRPRAPVLYGNIFDDLGPSAFGVTAPPGENLYLTRPQELVDGFSEMDEYLMGLRAASDVKPFSYIRGARGPASGLPYPFVDALDNVLLVGQREEVTIQDIQRVHGPRTPAFADEDDDGTGRDVKTIGFVLVVGSGTPSSYPAEVGQLDDWRRAFEAYVNGSATGGRGRFDTRLSPPVH